MACPLFFKMPFFSSYIHIYFTPKKMRPYIGFIFFYICFMVEPIINYINTQISELKIFKEVKGLCQYVQQEVADGEFSTIKKFPAYYKGKDQLENVTDYDFRNGIIFHLKNGDVNIEPLESMRSQSQFARYTIPIKLVCIHLRQAIDDTAYTPDKFGFNLSNKITKISVNSLRSTTVANKINIQSNSYSTDPETIDNIFQNVEIAFKEELTIVTLDYNIFVEAYNDCFQPYTC